MKALVPLGNRETCCGWRVLSGKCQERKLEGQAGMVKGPEHCAQAFTPENKGDRGGLEAGSRVSTGRDPPSCLWRTAQTGEARGKEAVSGSRERGRGLTSSA